MRHFSTCDVAIPYTPQLAALLSLVPATVPTPSFRLSMDLEYPPPPPGLPVAPRSSPPYPSPNARSIVQRERYQRQHEAEAANPLLNWWNRIKKFNRPPIARTRPQHFAKRHDAGPCDVECRFCGASHWIDERNVNTSIRDPRFAKCCSDGRVELPPLGGVEEEENDEDEGEATDEEEGGQRQRRPRFRWLERMLTEDSAYSARISSR
jgi:hypothetical protein